MNADSEKCQRSRANNDNRELLARPYTGNPVPRSAVCFFPEARQNYWQSLTTFRCYKDLAIWHGTCNLKGKVARTLGGAE